MLSIIFVVLKYTPLLASISLKLNVSSRLVTFIIWLIACLVAIQGLYSYFATRELRHDFNSGQLSEVSGCIYAYTVTESKSRSESFSVSDVTFSYIQAGPQITFFQNNNFKDNFIKDGRCVTITYVPTQRNNIVKIVEL